MDESSEPSQNDDPSTSDPLPEVIIIATKGDILLDITFETSKSTLKATRKATPKPRPGQRDPLPPQPILKPQIRLAYRVDLATLKKHSRYFTNLLGDTRFQEARIIASRFSELSIRNEKPGDVDPAQLPRVNIVDDDEATRSAGREKVFSDMLRILHGLDPVSKSTTMLYAVTLAVMADRFACTAPVSRYLSTGFKKWPATPQPKAREDGLSGLSLAAEEVLRQKVLVSWLLNQPTRFAMATRELVIYGSHRWSMDYAAEEDEYDDISDPARDSAVSRQEAVWWYLPDDLEEELHHRRHLLLRTLASIPSHFLTLYTTRSRGSTRLCKLGYDSSSACDSFQLGEMVKFLVSKNLLFLTNFSSSSLEHVKDFAAVDVNSILTALKQCPNYQVDRNHTNCGMRTRLMPILEYVTSMLSATVVSVSLTGWKEDRKKVSWIKPDKDERGENNFGRKRDFIVGDENGENRTIKGKVFLFTRSVALDQRLRYEGVMAADRMSKELFTSDSWDWTPEQEWSGNSSHTMMSTRPLLGLK